MPLSDPKERFRRMTQTDFVLNKRELRDEFKTACAVVRLDRIGERKWISVLILQVLVWTVCLCVISKLQEWEILPCDTDYLCYSCFIYDMIINTGTGTHMRRCTPTCNKKPGCCFVCMSAALTETSMGCVTPSHYPRIPAGSLGTSSSS